MNVVLYCFSRLTTITYLCGRWMIIANWKNYLSIEYRSIMDKICINCRLMCTIHWWMIHLSMHNVRIVNVYQKLICFCLTFATIFESVRQKTKVILQNFFLSFDICIFQIMQIFNIFLLKKIDGVNTFLCTNFQIEPVCNISKEWNRHILRSPLIQFTASLTWSIGKMKLSIVINHRRHMYNKWHQDSKTIANRISAYRRWTRWISAIPP